jgi:DNA-binding beta-propeller fold protein YncE
VKHKTTFLILAIQALLYGCGDKTEKAKSAGLVSNATAPPSVAAITAPIPVRIDACSSQAAGTETGRQMGGARQCLPQAKMAAIPVKHTGPFASFSQPVAITTDGINLYVVDNDKVRKVSITTGEVTTLTRLRRATDHKVMDSAHGFPGITTDGINLYVADQEHDEVRKVVIATGELTTMTEFKEECHKWCVLEGITFDGNYIYALGISKIFKIDPVSGKVITQFDPNDGSVMKPMPVNITTDGKYLYVLNQGQVDAGQATGPEIKKIDTDTGHVTTLTALTELGASSIKLDAYLTTDGNYLYITDPGRHCIYQVEIATGKMTTLAGSADSYASTDGIGEAATFLSPAGITSDGRNLYVSDRQDNKIRKIEISNRLTTTQAASILDSQVDGTGLAGYDLPVEGLASDGKYLYVTVPSKNPIRRIELGTNTVSTFVQDETTPIKKPQGRQASGIALNFPKGLVVQANKLYIAGYNNQTVRQVETSTGNVKTLAGSGVKDAQDGVGSAASFNYPYGLASDGANIYVTDYDNNSVRQIEIASGRVTTLAGSGMEGAQDGIGKAASFSNPRGLAYEAGILYVADYNNNLIRQVEIASGKVGTFAGSGEPGVIDGVGRESMFRQPSDIVAAGGKLYVADTYNNCIRQIDIATHRVSIFAGSGLTGAQDGVGKAASFNQPKALAKAGGKLYVADFGNDLIRSIDLATGVVETLTLRAQLTSNVVTDEQAKEDRQ